MIEIDVGHILHNVRALRGMLGEKVRLCCVVKGDAYGCGDVRMTRVLEHYAGVDMVAVAMLDEAMHLRDSGITLPILVLGDIADEEAGCVIERSLIPSVYRLGFARRLSEETAARGAAPAPVHVRLDVCSGSPGMAPERFAQALDELRALPGIRVAGVYTQLYGAYVQDKTGLQRQLEEFERALRCIPEKMRRELCVHAASTAAACLCPNARYDMVRVGAALYGLPFDGSDTPFLPVMSIRSRIISLKTVRGAAFAGYHDAEHSDAPRRLATVLGGYEDALFLMFVREGRVLVRGKAAPIVGEACMDTTTIDVTDIPEAQLGDEVVLLGRQGGEEITIADIMRQSGFTLANCQLALKTGRRTPKTYVNYPRNEAWKPLLRQAAAHSPALRSALEQAKGWTLRRYVERLAQLAPAAPLSDPGDLVDAAAEQLTPVMGRSAAQETASALQGCALTANHHGVDCFAQSMQGNLLFAHLMAARGVRRACLPVLACGSVPMDNSSYGKGLLLFDTRDGRYPLRVPVVPNRFNDSIVGLFPALTGEMVLKAEQALEGERIAGRLEPGMRAAARHALHDFYGSPRVLGLADYAQQACAINLEMTREATEQGFAYLSLERAASALLERDLANPASLASRIVLRRQVRDEVCAALDGAVGCWNRAALERGQWSAGGTALFWAVGEKWTRAPLLFDGDALRNARTGERILYEEIADALQEGRIYPALLMSFLPLLFERDIRCFGGCFQPEYLRVMRDGLRAALERAGERALAGAVAARDPSGYLSGPMFLEGRNAAPMGIVEMLARPMKRREWEARLDLPFEEAHRVALANLYPDLVPAAERVPDYTAKLNA